MLMSFDVDIRRLEQKIEEFFEKKVEKVEVGTPQFGLGLQRIIQRALLHLRLSGTEELRPEDLIATIFTEGESHAAYFLNQEGVTRLDVLEYITFESEPEYHDQDSFDDEDADGEEKSDSPLVRYTQNLNQRAVGGQIDPLIGREKELNRMLEILLRRRKNNPIIVGDQGVGKTALAEGLALKIAKGDVPQRFEKMQIFALDLGSVIAGTKYRGEFEKRLKSVIAALQKLPMAVLVIDEIHTIVGAGSTSGGSLDMANLLKPALSKGTLRVIGSTTYDEYRKIFERDMALARRFLKIELDEPSVEQTIKIIAGLRSKYEEHHNVLYSPEAIETATKLSAQFIKDRFLPDKAIDVIDEAGAVVALEREKSGDTDRSWEVSLGHIEKVVSQMAKIPVQKLTASDKNSLKNLQSKLGDLLFGQDEAIANVVRSIRRAKAGLKSPNKPIGSYLFVGPTGVGKTELARQIANLLGIELLRFDMSEYMEQHAVARLIGAPPGYIGYDQGGLLTDAVIKNPHSVVLLDEFEKAHPDIFNILLQVLDNAELTDNSGRVAHFHNCIIIMTSNVGSESVYGKSIGFSDQAREVSSSAIEKSFRPEFRNRLDSIVKFNSLPMEVVQQIVDKHFAEFELQLRDKKVALTLTSAARVWLAEKGFSPLFGARELSRLIEKEVKDVLAEEILYGKLESGGNVLVDLEEDKIRLHFTPNQVKRSDLTGKTDSTDKDEPGSTKSVKSEVY